MKITKILGIAVVAAATAGTLVAGAIPASASPVFTPLNAGMVPAMQRDLGLSQQQAAGRLASENAAAGLEQSLSSELGESFGGASFDSTTGLLNIGVTDLSKLAQVRSRGADAHLVHFSAQQLDTTVNKLNAGEATAAKSLTGWGVDAATNHVTLSVVQGQRSAADAYLTKSSVDPSAVTVVETADTPKLQYDVRGGDAYYIANQARCSVGFSVKSGFISAGHCAAVGSSLAGYNQVGMGSFTRYSFPTNDYSLARTNSSWTPRGVLNNGTRVLGSSVAPTGASVCKSGSTTAWTCGTILAKNQTVRYAEGTVYGMTATNIQSAAGDSGGSVISGNQAQGLLSGGTSTTMYFFPVNVALNALGASLVLG
jgi:streptogrisin C